MSKTRLKNLENKFNSNSEIFVFGIVPQSNEVHNDNGDGDVTFNYECDLNIALFGEPSEKQMKKFNIRKL